MPRPNPYWTWARLPSNHRSMIGTMAALSSLAAQCPMQLVQRQGEEGVAGHHHHALLHLQLVGQPDDLLLVRGIVYVDGLELLSSCASSSCPH
jgi:hypothetical protein